MKLQLIKDFIAKNFKYLLIGILIVIIFFQRCSQKDCEISIKTTVDTVWHTKTDTIVKTVPIFKEKLVIPKGEQYQNSSDIDTCNKRLTNIINEFALMRIYKDSIPLSADGLDFGYIAIKDTVWLNKLKSREVFRNIKIPQITRTVTNTVKEAKRQIYVGGNILGNTNGIHSIAPGLIYKDRKDRMFTLNANILFNGDVFYGGGMYWKIDLNKKK